VYGEMEGAGGRGRLRKILIFLDFAPEEWYDIIPGRLQQTFSSTTRRDYGAAPCSVYCDGEASAQLSASDGFKPKTGELRWFVDRVRADNRAVDD
jgi:hypothetical protein